jgi:hypothetical protein
MTDYPSSNTTSSLLVEQDTAAYFPTHDELFNMVTEIPRPTITVTGQHQQPFPIEICHRIVQFLLVRRVNMQHVTAVGCSSLDVDCMLQPIRARRRRDMSNSNSNNDSSRKESERNELELLSYCLQNDEETYWMSQECSDDESTHYVDFSCGNNEVVRVQSVSIQIPPMPYGPLSLRDFYLQKASTYNNPDSNPNKNTDSTDGRVSTAAAEATTSARSKTTTTSITVWETISPVWTLCGESSNFQTFDFPNPGVDVRYLRLQCISNQASHSTISAHIPPSRYMRNVTSSMIGFYTIRFD